MEAQTATQSRTNLAIEERRLASRAGRASLLLEHAQALYVVRGEVVVEARGDLLAAGAGCAVVLPGGRPHALGNRGADEARFLTVRATHPADDDGLTGRPVGQDAPRLIHPPPGRMKVLVRGDDSGGRLALVDSTVEAGHAGPLLHHHPFDEAFYILEGALTFRLGDEDVTARAGELALAPGGTPHTFANLGAEEARMLIVCAPAGFERYFDRAAASERGDAPPPPEDIDRYPEITVVGPRIGD